MPRRMAIDEAGLLLAMTIIKLAARIALLSSGTGD
jgi:hypothetical protein